MKPISLEKQIYLCKYHEVDKIGLSTQQAKDIINKLKKEGLYEKYKNMPEDEYEQVIKEEKRLRKLKMEDGRKKQVKEEPKNKLLDLNDFLFQQLETLMDDSLTQEQLNKEIQVSKQVVSVSQTIINNANLLLQAKKHFDTTENKNSEIAPLLRLQ